MLRTLTIPIQAGQLTIHTQREQMPLEECVTYATRQNPRRLYLFVSKVLGKHWPVRPCVMRNVHLQLAAAIGHLPGPMVVIGLAETATALGRGVAEEAATGSGREDILYLQTTRYRLARPVALGFDESHSHAPDHIVYWPDAALQPLFREAQTLVLVDDEISTGRTLVELASAYLRLNPRIAQIALVSITNWLSAARQATIEALFQRPVVYPAVIEGHFSFTPNVDFPAPALPPVVASSAKNLSDSVTDPARTGVLAGRWVLPPLPPLPLLPRDRPLAMIGTGEYAYIPFRIALALEAQGYDVCFQSTTRSPILLGDAIASRREFPDHYGEGVPHYLYNLDPERLPVLCYEHAALAARCSLAGDLGGVALVGKAV